MVRIHRGYVKSDGKVSLEKFKGIPDSKLRSIEEVKGLDSYGGILAENIVLVDIDDEAQAVAMMKIVQSTNLKTVAYKTTRGVHLLFENNGMIEKNRTGAKMAIGLEVDIKLGDRNSYQTLKRNGEVRRIVADTTNGMTELDTIPKWMLPVSTNVEFWGMKEGDGRNQALYNYIPTLGSHAFNKDEVKFVTRIINNYVFNEPLGAEEVETVLREESLEIVDTSVFFEKNRFMHNKFADFMIKKHNIKRINGELHVFRDGIYMKGDRHLEHEMDKELPILKSAQRDEVIKTISVRSVDNIQSEDHAWIAFKNGVYNIYTKDLKPYSPEYILTNRIPWNFNPDAESDVIDKSLDDWACGDENIRKLMEEMIGFTMYRRNELRKAFILIGDKENGKSTFLDTVTYMLDEANVSSLDLNALGDRFMTAELTGMLANIGDDIESEFIQNTGNFKKLVTGERITVERKGEDPFHFRNYSKLLFSANSIPRLGKGKDTAAIMSRIIIVPFNASFSPSDGNFDPDIKFKLRSPDAMEYLIQLGIKGLRRVIENNGFTTSEKVDNELTKYEIENNPVLEYFIDMPATEVVDQVTHDVYSKYQQWCIAEGLRPMAHPTFSKEVNSFYGTETVRRRVNGDQVRVFEKETK